MTLTINRYIDILDILSHQVIKESVNPSNMLKARKLELAGINPDDKYRDQKYYLRTRKGKQKAREKERNQRIIHYDRIQAYEKNEERRKAKREYSRKYRKFKKELPQYIVSMYCINPNNSKTFMLDKLLLYICRDRRYTPAVVP